MGNKTQYFQQIQMHRTCKKCGCIKPLHKFPYNRTKQYYYYYCNECHKKQSLEYYQRIGKQKRKARYDSMKFCNFLTNIIHIICKRRPNKCFNCKSVFLCIEKSNLKSIQLKNMIMENCDNFESYWEQFKVIYD